MPYVDTVGDVIVCSMAVITGNPQLQEVRIFYQCVSSGGGDSRALINTNLDAACNTNWVPFLKATDVYFGSRVGFPKGGPAFAPTVTRVNIVGASSSNKFPEQCRGLITWRTGSSGVRYRGRSYLPTPTIAYGSTGGHFSSGYVTLMSAWATALIANQNVGGSVWIRVLKHFPSPKSPTPVPTPITAFEASTLVATQRRSGDRGRPNANPPW